MSPAKPNGETTLFWRLAVLRVQAERIQAELAQLRAAVEAADPQDKWDFAIHLGDAAKNAEDLVDYLTPMPEHRDRKLQTMEVSP